MMVPATKLRKPPENLIVYIDGFNLYHGLHDKFGRSMLWLDFVALAQSLRPQSNLVAVKYFTAPVLDDPAALGRQTHHQSAVEAMNPKVFSVTQGRYQSKEVECRKCHHKHTVREEKETDVNIAVTLVSDASWGRMKSALIISADSDLGPAVRTAREIRSDLFIAAAFPPERFSSELKALMPSSFHIGNDKIRQAQLPASFQVGGRSFDRPSKWQ